MLEVLERHRLVEKVVLHSELHRDLQHHRRKKRHPGGAVRLLKIAARRQRAAAVEDPDVVEPEEAPREHVVPIYIFAVYPPGEVQRQLLEAELEEGKIPTPAQLLVVAVHGPDRPREYRGIDIAEVPLVGGHLSVRVEVMVAQE